MKNRRSNFYVLKRRIMHPTQLPAYLGLVWGFLTILTVPPIITELKLGVDFYLIIFIPPIFLFGLCGYFMVRRNQYFNHMGDLVHGFPSKFYGYFTMATCWIFALLFIAAFIFRW